MKPTQDPFRQIKDLFTSVARSAEVADARIERVNELIRRGHSLGIWTPQLLLGSIVSAEPYALDVYGSGRVVQAALEVPEGFGGVYWDSEEFAALLEDQRIQEALGRVVSYQQFSELERVRLSQQFDPFWEQLLRSLRRPVSNSHQLHPST